MKIILDEDLLLLVKRIKQLEKQIFDLGEDFAHTVNQSSETWHDNAPFDAVRDKQSILHFEITKLKVIRKEAVKTKIRPSKKIQIGSKVTLKGSKTMHLMIGGNWIGRELVDCYTLVSCESPVALKLIGKKIGDEVELPFGRTVIGLII